MECTNTPNWTAVVQGGDPLTCSYFDEDPKRCLSYADIASDRNNVYAKKACCACGGGVFPEGDIDRSSYSCEHYYSDDDSTSAGSKRVGGGKSTVWLSVMLVILFNFY